MMKTLVLVLSLFITASAFQNESQKPDQHYVLIPQYIFDGETATLSEGYAVSVRGTKIEAIFPANQLKVSENTKVIELPGTTLMPGMIEGHSHVYLHPYTETPWDIQVSKESFSYRTARAVNHLRDTLLAGFTTIRDLGTEGAGYGDVGLKQAVNEGIIPGPRLFVVTKAIVATGSYAPKGFASEWDVPQGAEEADGVDALIKVVRSQIGKGADWIKVYADSRWGKDYATPTFTLDELKIIVQIARNAGIPVSAHATSLEGMRNATLAGVESIEHGDEGNLEVFQLMKERGVAYCPTLSVGSQDKHRDMKRESFKAALKSGVTISMGSDVGVFPHGDNARELEAMVNLGMPPLDALRSTTSINAKVLHMENSLGKIKPGYLADIIAVEGNPTRDISGIRKIKFVMKNGVVYK